MNKEQKSGSFFASIGRAIEQAARWVAKMFGYKAENKFARCVWYVFASAAAIVTLYVAIALTIIVVDEVGNLLCDYKYRRKVNDPHLSPRLP